MYPSENHTATLFNRDLLSMSVSTIVDRIRTLLERTPPFDRLPEEERADLLTDVSIEYFKPGEVVIEQGSTVHKGLYIVESGMVRMMDLETRRLIDKCGEGDFFGSFGLLKSGSTIYQVKAVEPTVCALLHGGRFQQLYNRYDDFAVFFKEDIKRYMRHFDHEMDATGAHLLLTRRLNQLVHHPPVTCSPDVTVQVAARLMNRKGADALLVVEGDEIAGILTDTDLRSRFVAQGHAPDMAVSRVMTAPVHSVTTEASLFDALMVMLKQRVHHVVVTDAAGGEGRPVGMVTDRDVAHVRGLDPIATVRRIDGTLSLQELASIRLQISELILRLFRQGVHPELLCRTMSRLYDRLAVRVLEIVEQELKTSQSGCRVDLPWVWLRLGSEGREEVSLTTRQHNALLYADPRSEEEAERADAWFSQLAEKAHRALEACGFPAGEIVAREASWRRPLREWKQAYREWVLQAEGDTLAASPLFFDLRGVYGDEDLVCTLRRSIEDALNVQAMDVDRRFLPLLAEGALRHRPGFSLLRRFGLERLGNGRGTVDLRERGLRPVTDAARVLALELRFLTHTHTLDRLAHAAEAVPEMSRLLREVQEAYRYLSDFRIEHQLRAFEAGDQPDDDVNPHVLNKAAQNLLRDALTTVGKLQETLAERYGLEE